MSWVNLLFWWLLASYALGVVVLACWAEIDPIPRVFKNRWAQFLWCWCFIISWPGWLIAGTLCWLVKRVFAK